jgi:hypothetical protein
MRRGTKWHDRLGRGFSWLDVVAISDLSLGNLNPRRKYDSRWALKDG